MRLKIEKLIYGGPGLSRTEDKVVFVDGAVPGDIVDADVIDEKKNFDIAQINNIIKRSELRTEPRCEYFRRCGGCQWQHIDYEYQLKAKEQILYESLQKIAGIKDFKILEVVSSPKTYNYRNRVALHVETLNLNHALGFKEEKSHELVSIRHCAVCTDNISKVIEQLSDFLSRYESCRLPIDKMFIMDAGNVAAVSITPVKNASLSDLNKFYYALKQQIKGVYISINNKEECSVEFEVSEIKCISRPSVFAQANPDINVKIIETLIQWAEISKTDSVLDLYCGYGNFSLQIAPMAKYVIGVDSDSKAIKYARNNAKLNSIKNCKFESRDVKKFLKTYMPKQKTDLIILDPPRTGAKQIIKQVINLTPKKILYVSCNPTTLARDLKLFTIAGYALNKIQPFDMFPHTYHLESLSLLEKVLE